MRATAAGTRARRVTVYVSYCSATRTITAVLVNRQACKPEASYVLLQRGSIPPARSRGRVAGSRSCVKHVSRYRDQLRGVSIEVVGRNDRDKRTPGVYITCLRNEHLSIIHMLLNLILGLNLIDGFEPDLVMGQTYMDSIASDATSGRTSTSSRRTGRREPRPRGRKGRTSTLRLA